MKTKKAYVRVYRYNYQDRIGIVGLDQETMEELFPIPNIEGVGGPFFFELTAKRIKKEDIPTAFTIIRVK